jgi:hypothetical protein
MYEAPHISKLRAERHTHFATRFVCNKALQYSVCSHKVYAMRLHMFGYCEGAILSQFRCVTIVCVSFGELGLLTTCTYHSELQELQRYSSSTHFTNH